jgi:hypothetical protein
LTLPLPLFLLFLVLYPLLSRSLLLLECLPPLVWVCSRTSLKGFIIVFAFGITTSISIAYEI